MSAASNPTERELEILKILWERGEASVRDVYERMRETAPIVQNTVQAFLRTMEEKRLVRHRVEGADVHLQAPVGARGRQTTTQLTTEFVQHVFDGAIDQLVETAFSHHTPSEAELTRLEELVAEVRAARAQATSFRKAPFMIDFLDANNRIGFETLCQQCSRCCSPGSPVLLSLSAAWPWPPIARPCIGSAWPNSRLPPR